MEIFRVVTFPKNPYRSGSMIGAGIHVRPQDNRRDPGLVDRRQGLFHLKISVVKIRCDRMLQDDDEVFFNIDNVAGPSVFWEQIIRV